jgi:hypothetical protein
MPSPLHKTVLKRIFTALSTSALTIVFSLGLSLGLLGCASSNANVLVDLVSLVGKEQPKDLVHLQEVAKPPLIQTLHAELDRYQPQVKITAPTPGEVINQTTVQVSLAVEDYPLFKNAEFGMGPHVHLFLDDQPYTAVYSTSEPVVLTDLAPGTHTLRAFASRPWHESFKNEGAYAQVTFHVLTETGSNAPDPAQPLLTYSRPQSTYGAEPIMLDFYLTNAPLHFLASTPDDDIPDWRVRATINGESFLIDRWEPIYLSGFAEGDNWVKLEFLGEEGEPIPNVFNTTARLINYTPGGQDGLARIVRGDVSLEEALAIVRPPDGVSASNPAPEVSTESTPDAQTVAEPVSETTSEPDLEAVVETVLEESTEQPEEEATEPATEAMPELPASEPELAAEPSPDNASEGMAEAANSSTTEETTLGETPDSEQP